MQDWQNMLPCGFSLWNQASSAIQQKEEKARTVLYSFALVLSSRSRALFSLRAREHENARKARAFISG
jgi:hypothetical protein